MEIAFPKPTPELVAKYLSFWAQFWWKPAEPLRTFAGKRTVAGELLYFLAIGVSLAYLVGLIAGRIGTQADPSAILGFVRKFSLLEAPGAALVLIVVVTSLFHLLGRVLILLQRFSERSGSPTEWDPHLGGSLADSINAAVGFGAFLIPVGTLALSMNLVAARISPDIRLLPVITGILMAALVVAYFPAALAQSHPNTSFRQAFITFGGAVVLVGLLLEWVS